MKGSVANESWMGKSFVDDDKEPDEDVGVQPQRKGDVFCLPYCSYYERRRANCIL